LPLLLALCLGTPVLATPVLADEPPPTVAPDLHAGTGIRAREATAPVPLPPRDAARAAGLGAIEMRVACACYEGGDLRIDKTRGTGAAACPCPFAATVRSDLEAALAGVATANLTDKRAVAEAIEGGFLELQPEYPGLFRFAQADYDWFMDNVRCVCDGCKPTIFFSKCQLTCTPAIVYKKRVPLFLAMGFSRDEVLDYYHAEFNAGRAPREQVERDWLLPGKQRESGWLVPALAISGTGGALWYALRRLVRRGRKRQEPVAPVLPQTPADVAARRRLENALADDQDAW